MRVRPCLGRWQRLPRRSLGLPSRWRTPAWRVAISAGRKVVEGWLSDSGVERKIPHEIDPINQYFYFFHVFLVFIIIRIRFI